MKRRKRPNYFRSLTNLVPALIAGAIMLFDDALEGVLCSVSKMHEMMECAPMLPNWFFIAALGVVIASIASTCRAWYKDHVQGDYKNDLMRGTNRYRN